MGVPMNPPRAQNQNLEGGEAENGVPAFEIDLEAMHVLEEQQNVQP